jgi:hypothetical protein
LNANVDVGELSQEMLIPPLEEGDPDLDDSFSTRYGVPVIPRLAAVCDDTNIPREQEFRSAQRYHSVSGECPQTSGSDHCCMAVLVKVNGIEAYALLDTGSTTMSITYDFAHVAKLSVIQLENPVLLQLGTIGSQSIINYGARTHLELGPISEDDAYLDVVNIDWYDIIIGTPFMRKHGLVPDFKLNALSIQGEHIPTLTSGQEDLMLTKKRVLHACVLHAKGQQVHTSQ